MSVNKVKRYYVNHFGNNGESSTHYDGVFQPGDVALCGHDLMGDSHLGWDQGVETKRKVNCQSCLIIIEHVKSIINPNPQP